MYAHEVYFEHPWADGGSGLVGRSLDAEHVAYWRGVASIMRPGIRMHTAKIHMAGYPDQICGRAGVDVLAWTDISAYT